jgi:hypothetical protein
MTPTFERLHLFFIETLSLFVMSVPAITPVMGYRPCGHKFMINLP